MYEPQNRQEGNCDDVHRVVVIECCILQTSVTRAPVRIVGVKLYVRMLAERHSVDVMMDSHLQRELDALVCSPYKLYLQLGTLCMKKA